MGSNEQPDGASERALTLRLTPENVILAAAVLFLLAAVILAIFFSLESPNATGPTGTPIAINPTAQGTSSAIGTAPTSAAYPGPGSLFPTVSGQPYPGPGEPGGPTAVGIPGETTLPGGFATPTPIVGSLPTFDPSRPTDTGNGGSNPYPGPGGQQPTPVIVTPAPVYTPIPQPTPDTSFPTPDISFPTPDTSIPPTPPPPRPTATAVPPTAVPIDVVRGSMHWTANQSPITLPRDLQVAAGSTLVIEPGVEVRVAPGAAIYVDGKLYAAGTEGNPVRFTSAGAGRWDAIYGNSNSDIGLEYANVSRGGNGGTLIASKGGNLSIMNSRISDNGGHISAIDSRVDIRNSEISGNDMPYGGAINASYGIGGGITLQGNRIGGNRLAPGAPPVEIRNENPYTTLNMNVQGNLLVGEQGPDMVVYTDGGLLGSLSCNAMLNGTDGLMVKSSMVQVAPQIQLDISNNAIEDQTPPIIPTYLKYGIGRGATSDLYIDMKNNWWRSDLGPYHPDLHADGRGNSVGANITFEPWLTARPGCAPTR